MRRLIRFQSIAAVVPLTLAEERPDLARGAIVGSLPNALADDLTRGKTMPPARAVLLGIPALKPDPLRSNRNRVRAFSSRDETIRRLPDFPG